MGTPTNPGRHDCLAHALPGEPYFVLLARDPLAGHLVSIWSKLRMGADIEAAQAVFRHLCVLAERYWLEPDAEKAAEALDCAMAMIAWRKANDGRWREPRPHPAPPAPGVTLSRGEHEAIHRKLDLILEGQRRLMAQSDDLMAALTAISGDVDTTLAHVTDLEAQLKAKSDDLGVDLSAEITLANSIRAKLEGVAQATSDAAPPAADGTAES